MNVIAKISCYHERGVVTLKLRKEYLNSVTYTTSFLLRIKYWTVWCIERYSMSTYTGVTNCQKQSVFLAHPVQYLKLIVLFCSEDKRLNMAAAVAVTKYCMHSKADRQPDWSTAQNQQKINRKELE